MQTEQPVATQAPTAQTADADQSFPKRKIQVRRANLLKCYLLHACDYVHVFLHTLCIVLY